MLIKIPNLLKAIVLSSIVSLSAVAQTPEDILPAGKDVPYLDIEKDDYKKRFWQLDVRAGVLTQSYDRNVDNGWDHKNLKSPNFTLGIQSVTNLSTVRHKFFWGLELNYFRSFEEISKGGGASITTTGLALLMTVGFSYRPIIMGPFGFRFFVSPILTERLKSELKSKGLSRQLQVEDDDGFIITSPDIAYGGAIFYEGNGQIKPYLQISSYSDRSSQVTGGVLYGF